MAAKTYQMYCAIARALEVVGERWTLLLVRELLTGPKRFADLQAGLPGIATNLLTDRIRHLLEAGVIDQYTTPPPTPAALYRLTAHGQALKPVLLALADWGTPRLGSPRPGEQFRLAWLMIALDGRYDPSAAAEPVSISIRVEGEDIGIHAHRDTHEVTLGAPAGAGIALSADQDTFLAWVTGMIGDADALARGMEVSPGPEGLAQLRMLYPHERKASP